MDQPEQKYLVAIDTLEALVNVSSLLADNVQISGTVDFTAVNPLTGQRQRVRIIRLKTAGPAGRLMFIFTPLN